MMTSAEKKKRARAFYVPMKRLRAEIKPDGYDLVSKARLLLFELNPESAYLFSSDGLAVGEPVSVVIQCERPLYLKGVVNHCHRMTQISRMIHIENYDYRIGVTFKAEDAKAKDELIQFYHAVAGKMLKMAA